jgi:hypothetical protein
MGLVILLAVVAIAAVMAGLFVGWALALFLVISGLFASLFVWRAGLAGDAFRGWAAAHHTGDKPDDLDYSFPAAIRRFVGKQQLRRNRRR